MKKTRLILLFLIFCLCGCNSPAPFDEGNNPEASLMPTAPFVDSPTFPIVSNPSESAPSVTGPIIQELPFIKLESMAPAENITDIVLADAGEELLSLLVEFAEYPYYEPALDIKDVFILDSTGNFAQYIHETQLHQIALTPSSTTITHKGVEYQVGYQWCEYDSHLAVWKNASSIEYSIDIVNGSSQYAGIRFGGWYDIVDGYYTYLLDVKTGVVTDPLAQLGEDNRVGMSFVTFSPDGHYAFVPYDSMKDLLLNCWSGDIFEIPTDEGVQNVTVDFINSEQMLICYSKMGFKRTKQWILYDLQTGEYVDCTKFFVPHGESDDVSVSQLCGAVFSVRISGDTYDEVYITDFAEQQFVSLKTQNPGEIRTFTCADGKIGVIHENVVYVVDLDAGTMTPVLRIEDVTQ